MEHKPGFMASIKSWFNLGAEGSYRGPALGLGELGHTFEIPFGDGFQRNLAMGGYSARHVAPVYSMVMINARAVMQCTPQHMIDDGNGGFKRTFTTPAARILRNPNSYETFAQLIFNSVAELLFEGESLWVAVRDERFAIQSVHRIPRGSWSPYVDPESGEIYYGISKSSNLAAPEFDMLVPQRDVFHLRIHTPRNPLIGESPVKAAAMAIGISVALNQSQMAFYNNMSRPSGIITTDQQLNQVQIDRLKIVWEAAAAALAQGKTPVLMGGLRWQATSIPQTDQQLIEQQKLSIADIARVYGVPMALISESNGPQGATEALINHWLSIGLGSIIEAIERSLERLFRLPAQEKIELDPTPLLRVDFVSRIDGLAKAVQGGILSPNEARSKEGFGTVKGGDDAFMQQQMVPVSLLNDLHSTAIQERLDQAEPALPTPAVPDPETTKALIVQMKDYKRKSAA